MLLRRRYLSPDLPRLSGSNFSTARRGTPRGRTVVYQSSGTSRIVDVFVSRLHPETGRLETQDLENDGSDSSII